jgi:hypothetical protein
MNFARPAQRSCLAFASALALAGALAPLAAAAEPGLPSEESFLYSRKVGDKADEVAMRSRLVSEKGERYFELTIKSADQDALYKLDPTSLFASYSDVTTRNKESTIRRIVSILENRAALKDDELLISGTDAGSIGQSLRVFPWGQKQKVKLVFLGTPGGGNFSFDLSVAGKEKLVVGGRELECWKAQLGMSGIFGGLVGKTNLWFLADYPHYMVRYEGGSGAFGPPPTVMELKSYTAGASASAPAP